MKWQVFDKQLNTKDYFDPNSKSLIMSDCNLGNHPKTAQRIHDGENKTVCAWVDCEDVRVVDNIPLSSASRLTNYMFNPRKNPHWYTTTNKNRDNAKFKTMYTINRKVYG